MMRHTRRLILALAALAACGEPNPSAPIDGPPAPAADFLYAHSFEGATLGDRISAAIDALPPTGGIVDATDFTGAQRIDRTITFGPATKPVELRLGTVTLSASVVPFDLHSNVKLIGNGATLVTQDSAANLEWLITGTNVSECEIAYLTVDGNRAANTGAGSGIGLHTAQRCWLHHLVVRNTVGRLHPGIAFYDGGNRDNTIEHNIVQNIGTLVDYADGIYVSGPGNQILFNRIFSATDFGIVGETCAGCLIFGNAIVDVPAGISVGSGVATTTAAANIIDGNSISGGNTTTWGMITIYRTNGTAPVASIIRGNVIRDVRLGNAILIKGAEQVTVEGNLIGNIGVASDSYGILVQESRDVNITGGAIDSTGTFGIGIGASANVRIDGVLITDAARSGNGASGIGLDAIGGNSTSISVTRNHIFDTDTIPAQKRMLYCVDFGQAGTTAGILIGENLFDDGVNAVGCRAGAVNFNNTSRVTRY